uniref:Uncharacterized protein n=1 Tax=Romanomermis culicivorax TaxID=13658 RepID=A0A915KTV9_ROMCU
MKKSLVNQQFKPKKSRWNGGGNGASKRYFHPILDLNSKQKSQKRRRKHEAINESQVVSLAISTTTSSGEEKASGGANAKSNKTTPMR